ncbi:DUF4111 domain-containing protein [Myroides odoratimimus]|nr:DUF4111 domain-containing protein [Myroides odoratimimus]
MSKDKAVDYILPITPDKFKPILVQAKAVYLGESNVSKDTDVDVLHQFADLKITLIK